MEMFNGTQSLSDYNKCAINATFSSNDNWPYNWEDLCYFWPQSNDELGVAVDLWCDDNEAALELYGPINDWDVSLITSMSYLFMNKSAFNSDISNWDVSNVTTMVEMFKNATSFNQDLSNWDVSNVEAMNEMFLGCSNFNGNINNWNVSSVEICMVCSMWAHEFNV